MQRFLQVRQRTVEVAKMLQHRRQIGEIVGHRFQVAPFPIDGERRLIAAYRLLMVPLMPSQKTQTPQRMALPRMVGQHAPDRERFTQRAVGFGEQSELRAEIAPAQVG